MKARHDLLIVAAFDRVMSVATRARLLRPGLVLALLLTLIQLAAPAAARAGEPAPGFSARTVVSVYGDPTDMAWLGSDLLIATENGWLFRLDGDVPPGGPAGTAQMILDVSSVVGQGQEQGLLGVVADPDFPARPYIYLFYTRAHESGHCLEYPANCDNRVSRFTMGADGLLDPATELPLLHSILVGPLHNAGDLEFDAENLLYISTGDAGRWENGQDLSNLNGKILRITRDGAPAPGNPYGDDDTVACDDREPGTAAVPCPEIFAYGLRNPFRIAFDPSETSPVFYINDVGQEAWEEINLGIPGANYGWPMREGPCPTESDAPCEPAPNLVEPIFAYAHETGCFAITGGAFVPAWSSWGEAFRQKYLFADWGCASIFSLNQGADGSLAATRFADGLPAVTALLFSPDGTTLYYAYEEEEGEGRIDATWHCPGRSLLGSWPPACLWGSGSANAPGGE